MARKRQLVLSRSSRGGPLVPIGSPREVFDSLARFNIAPDGGKRPATMEVLFGPGMVVEFPTGQDAVSQAMITVQEEEMAMPVLLRMCKNLGLSMVDLESGRSIG
ncbi:MAG: hypothetical protein ACKVW3_17855 [Phycisphaerales bacterium]